MPLIIGLDVAQATGYAIFETSRSPSAIRAGVLKAVGGTYEEKAATLARAFGMILKAGRPDLVAIEMPIRTQPAARRKVKMMGEEEVVEGGGGLNAVISSNQLVGSIAGICGWKDIPFVMIAPVTWRTSFLGFGRRAGWARKDWKRAVREQCAREHITVTSDDQADAVGVAIAAQNTDAFKMIRHRAEQERTAA